MPGATLGARPASAPPATTRPAAACPAAVPGRRRARRLALAALALIGVAAGAPPTADAQSVLGREPSGQEAVLPDPMPQVPPPEKTLQFYVSPTTTNRFAIDPASFGIDGQTVVRFTLIVTSATGVRNVSYEALRCDSAEQKLLAVARVDGTWSVVRNARWQRLDRNTASNRHRPELYSRLCEGSVVAAKTPEKLATRVRATATIAP
jgi:hypothetical protein